MRCKVGDLVVVTGVSLDGFPENLGRFGTVVADATADHSSPSWWVMPQHKFKCWASWAAGETRSMEAPDEVSFADTSLTPIRPGDLVEDTETEQTKETA